MNETKDKTLAQSNDQIWIIMVATKSSASNVFQDFDEYVSNDVKVVFTEKFTKSTKNNPMSGICFSAWMEIVKSRWDQIEYFKFWPRILMLTLLSLFNSFLALIETIIHEKSIQNTQPHPSPVFILGHPRTGTTLLHSLMALDEERFAFCTTFCAGFPTCFLWFEGIGKFLFRDILEETRPMDNIKLDFDLPQEDELAINNLSAGASPYMPLFFMSQEPEFRPYYAFDDEATGDEALPPSEMAKARNRWINAFYYLCQKLTLRAMRQSNQKVIQRLLLKSPVHTARMPLLLRIFPDAQFIYIHRNPYDVFRSAAHMADTAYWHLYLNTPRNEQILEFILRQYEILWDRYEEGRKMLQEMETNGNVKSHSRLVEVSFNELSQTPMEAMDRIYKTLGWEMSITFRQNLQEAVKKDVKTYQRNQHKELDPSVKATIQKRWGPSFDRLGYKK